MSYGGLYLIVAVPLLVVASVLALDSVVCVGGVSEDLKVQMVAPSLQIRKYQESGSSLQIMTSQPLIETAVDAAPVVGVHLPVLVFDTRVVAPPESE